MAWIYLILAGVFEIVWAIEIKYSDGFTKLWPSIITVAAMIFSFIALSLAAREIPLGTAYAIWTGIGAAGAVVFGMIWLDEPATFWRLISITALLMGMIGLKLST